MRQRSEGTKKIRSQEKLPKETVHVIKAENALTKEKTTLEVINECCSSKRKFDVTLGSEK